MKDIDAPLSEEVAKQAGKKINGLKKTIEDDKNLQNSILRDFVNDTRNDNKFIKKICVVLLVLLFFSIGGLVGMSVYNQYLIKDVTEKHNERLMEFMLDSTFETTMEIFTEDESTNSGDMTLNK